MIHAFALEPQLVATWGKREQFRFFREKFGLGTARVFLELPAFSKWKRAVYDTAIGLELTQEEMKRIEVLFQLFGEHKCRRTNSAYDGLVTWLENAEQEYNREHFAGIIAAMNPRGHAGVLVAEHIDSDTPPWACGVGLSPARTPEALTQAISAMLLNCKSLHLVDPYFQPGETRYRRMVEEISKVLAKRGSLPGDVSVYCRSDISGTLEFFETQAARLVGLLPNGLTVNFVRLQEKLDGEKLHNRYVLTDLGGVSFSAGLGSGGPNETDDLHLLSRETYELRWSQFADANGAFQCVDQPSPVTGTRTNW